MWIMYISRYFCLFPWYIQWNSVLITICLIPVYQYCSNSSTLFNDRYKCERTMWELLRFTHIDGLLQFRLCQNDGITCCSKFVCIKHSLLTFISSVICNDANELFKRSFTRTILGINAQNQLCKLGFYQT